MNAVQEMINIKKDPLLTHFMRREKDRRHVMFIMFLKDAEIDVLSPAL